MAKPDFSHSRITNTGRPGGELREVYHGTRGSFDRFQISERGSFGRGIYFASTIEQAEIFGGELRETIILAVNLNATRPYHYRIREPEVVDTWGEGLVYELFDGDVAGRLIEQALHGDGQFGAEIHQHLASRGYDAIIATFDDGSQELVVFSHEQVRILGQVERQTDESVADHQPLQSRHG